MAKRNRERRENEAPGSDGAGTGAGATQWLPMLLAAAALVLGFVAWTDTRAIKADLTKRVVALDQQLIALQTKVAQAPRAQQQPQGPDPNKAYPIKLEGRPSKGNPTAPIVIAEFSDYQ